MFCRIFQKQFCQRCEIKSQKSFEQKNMYSIVATKYSAFLDTDGYM